MRLFFLWEAFHTLSLNKRVSTEFTKQHLKGFVLRTINEIFLDRICTQVCQLQFPIGLFIIGYGAPLRIEVNTLNALKMFWTIVVGAKIYQTESCGIRPCIY